MAQPTPYNRQFNFADQQAQTPSDPLPATQVDAELNAVKLTFDQTLANLAKIQRDDGALMNGIVTQDSLSPSLSIGFTYRGVWQTGVNYLQSDGVSIGTLFYRAKVSHLSSAGTNPATSPATWELIADITPIAISANSVYTAALQDGAVTAAKLGALAVTEAKLAAGAVTETKIGDLAVAEAKLAGNAVSNAKLADMATQTFKARVSASTGDPEDATLAQVRTLLDLSSHGEYTLTKSGANLLLSGFGGNRLFINGALESIPAAGVTLAATSLTPGTRYYIYAYMNSGVMTLEASTTAYALGTAAPFIGWPIKGTDTTRTLVGQARPITGPAWQDTAAQRLVRSWRNRGQKNLSGTFTATRTFTNTGAFAEVNSEIRVEWLQWIDEAVTLSLTGPVVSSNSSVSVLYGIALDGTSPDSIDLSSATNFIPIGAKAVSTAEGYHYATVVGLLSSAGTGTLGSTGSSVFNKIVGVI